MYIKVIRRNRPDCIVMLCKDRATKKWCYVNLSTEHVCACRFDTIDDALADIKKRADVESFSVFKNPFDPHLTANAISYKLPALDPAVYRAMIERSLKAVEEMDNRLSDLICKGFKLNDVSINVNPENHG